MSRAVLDASAVLAALKREPGADVVTEALAEGAAISAINLAEIVSKLADWGMDGTTIRATLDPLKLEVIAFDADAAYATGLLRSTTRQGGLSLGDRACMALAQRLGAHALTADRTWADLSLDVVIRVLR